jgi:hypothetical protein
MLKKLALFATALAAPALAQDPEFARVVTAIDAAAPAPSASETSAAALDILKAIAKEKGGCSPTSVTADAPAAATSTALATQMIGARQIKNAWTVYVTAQGCPAKAAAPIRFLLLRMPSGELLARVVNVGESLAAPSMMRDSSFIVAVAALAAIQKAHADCKGMEGMEMESSRVVSRSPDLGPDFYGSRYAGSWKEAWTFSVCGHRAEVPITFTTDGQGGASWAAHEAETKLID